MTQLEPDREMLGAFVGTMFRHAAPGNYASFRAFHDGGGGVFKITPKQINGSVDEMIDAACSLAREAANAKKSGLEQARAKLLKASGENSRLVGEKILHEKTENGKIYIDVHFEVEENIAIEQPIVTQGE